MIDKKRSHGYSLHAYPEKTRVVVNIKLIDYFGWWDTNNNGLVDSIEWRVMDEFFESFTCSRG